MNEKAYKNIVSLIIAITTFLGSFFAFLQVDANMRASTASRDNRLLAIQSIALNARTYSDWNREYGLANEYKALSTLKLLESIFPTEGKPVEETLSSLEQERLAELMEAMRPLATSLSTPYFNEQLQASDLFQLLVDKNIVPLAELTEKQELKKDEGAFWNNKSNSYLMGITILAVSLFLFALSLTISGRMRLIFTAAGLLLVFAVLTITLFVLSSSFVGPSEEAIATFSQAYGQAQYASTVELLSYHSSVDSLADKAISGFDKAINIFPDYDSAYEWRAMAHMTKGEALLFRGETREKVKRELDAAIFDFRRAIELGKKDLYSTSSLGWTLYLNGDVSGSLSSLEEALRIAPDQYFGLNLYRSLALLSSGKKDEAMTTLDNAIKWSLDHPLASDPYYFRAMIRNLDRLKEIEPHEGMEEMSKRLKEAFVSINTLAQTEPIPVSATISPLHFASAVYDEKGEIKEYNLHESFPSTTLEVHLLFDYAGMQNGMRIVQKVYKEGQELPLYGRVETWSLGQSGSAVWKVSYPLEGAINRFLAAGRYRIDLFVEGNLLSSGEFTVES